MPTRSRALDVVLGCLGTAIGLLALAAGVAYRSWPGLVLALVFLAAAVVLFRRARDSSRERQVTDQGARRSR